MIHNDTTDSNKVRAECRRGIFVITCNSWLVVPSNTAPLTPDANLTSMICLKMSNWSAVCGTGT